MKKDPAETYVSSDPRGDVGLDAERPPIELQGFQVEAQAAMEISQPNDGQLLQTGFAPLDGDSQKFLEKPDRSSFVAGSPALSELFRFGEKRPALRELASRCGACFAAFVRDRNPEQTWVGTLPEIRFIFIDPTAFQRDPGVLLDGQRRHHREQ